MKCEICNKEIDGGVAFTFGTKSFYILDSDAIDIVDERVSTTTTRTFKLNSEYPRICHDCWPLILLLMKMLNIERACEAVGMFLGDDNYGCYKREMTLTPTKMIRRKKG